MAHHVDDTHVVYYASTQLFMLQDDEDEEEKYDTRPQSKPSRKDWHKSKEEDDNWWSSEKDWHEYHNTPYPRDWPTMKMNVLGNFFKMRRSSAEARTPLGAMQRCVLPMMRPSLKPKRRRHATGLKAGQINAKPGERNGEIM